MGLFDSKKVKEEREIYRRLVQEKLMLYGITEKQFLKPDSIEMSQKKEDIINRYRQVIEINNNVTMLKQTPSIICNNIYDYFLKIYVSDLNDFVDCYKFLESKHDVYKYYRGLGNDSIIDFIISFDDINKKYTDLMNTEIANLYNESLRRSEENIHRYYQTSQEYAKRREQIANGPGMRAMQNRASETAREMSNKLGFKDYGYTPSSTGRRTQEEYDDRTMANREELIADLEAIRKSGNGRRGR